MYVMHIVMMSNGSVLQNNEVDGRSNWHSKKHTSMFSCGLTARVSFRQLMTRIDANLFGLFLVLVNILAQLHMFIWMLMMRIY